MIWIIYIFSLPHSLPLPLSPQKMKVIKNFITFNIFGYFK